MRLHEHFPILWPSYDESFAREMLTAQNLAAVRLEPVYSIRFEAFMDMIFERDGRFLVVPMNRIEGVSIMVPENPPVGWPAVYERFASHATEAIEELIAPWLRSITAGRLVNDEHVRFFRDEPEILDAYEQARSRKLMGATPYPDLLRSIGPAVYAQRFARNRRVALSGIDAPNAAAALSSLTTAIDADVDDFARRWFCGIAIGTIDATQHYGCYVGPRTTPIAAEFAVYDDVAGDGERAVVLAEPMPTDVTISFDAEDGPVARSFAVTERSVIVRSSALFEPPAAGGSSGVIRLVVRDDAMRFSDADSDGAAALAARLRGQGFDAQVTTAGKVDRDATDIIHVFGLRHGPGVVELLRDAEQRRIPVVVTPYADDRRDEAMRGSSGALLIPRVSSDTLTFSDFLSAFAKRKIANLSEGLWYDEASEVLMRRAACVIVSGSSEREFLAKRFGYAGASIPSGPAVLLESAHGAIGSLVGPDDFVLVHAPIEAPNNQLFAAIAAKRLGLPLVLAGPVADIEYFRYVNEWAGPNLIPLRDHELSAGEIAALYARARVVADVGWSSRGLERLARGACHGSAIVATFMSYASDNFGELAALADPADLDSIAQALAVAWERAEAVRPAMMATAARVCDPMATLVAAVTAYQQATAAPVS